MTKRANDVLIGGALGSWLGVLWGGDPRIAVAVTVFVALALIIDGHARCTFARGNHGCALPRGHGGTHINVHGREWDKEHRHGLGGWVVR